MAASKFRRLSRWGLGMLAAGLASFAGAQTMQDPADRLLKEQRERERDERLSRPEPHIAVPEADRQAVPLDADPASLADPEPSFPIEHIELTGNTVLSAAETERILAPFRGKQLGVNRINLLLKRLTEAFIGKGYITTRAYLGEQNLASGRLTITVVPGRIEAFRINGQTVRSVVPGTSTSGGPYNGGWFTDLGTLAAFPSAVGEALNLQDLEQGVDQLNRLRRNRAELQILPGQTPGGSVIALGNDFGDRYRVNLGVDNYGSRATGVTRSRLGLEFDNPLGFQEALSLAYVGSLDANALLGAFSVPLGYNTFSYTASYSEFQNLVADTALVYGRTTAHNFGWNRVLGRSRSSRSSLDATLSVRRAEREINNIVLTPQKLAVARIGWNALTRFTLGGGQEGNATFDVGVSRGLKALEANVDALELAAADAHGQFTKLDFAATLTVPLGSWSYRGGLVGQWTRVGLFGSEQIYLGGAGSVRGFTEAALSGDRGFYLRNDLAWTKAPPQAVFGKPLWLQPYLFVDAGRSELLSQNRWKRIAGAGAGLRAQWQAGKHQVLLELLVGTPLIQPAELSSSNAAAQPSLNWIL